MWKEDDTYSRLYLSDLMTLWIAALERVMATISSKTDGRKRQSFRADFATCFLSYVKETKKGRDLGTDLFSPLLEKMDMQELSHLAWGVYQLDIKDTASLKDFPKTFNMYHDLCLRLHQWRNVATGTDPWFYCADAKTAQTKLNAYTYFAPDSCGPSWESRTYNYNIFRPIPHPQFLRNFNEQHTQWILLRKQYTALWALWTALTRASFLSSL